MCRNFNFFHNLKLKCLKNSWTQCNLNENVNSGGFLIYTELMLGTIKSTHGKLGDVELNKTFSKILEEVKLTEINSETEDFAFCAINT